MEMVDQTVVPGAHRVIRRLSADEGPYAGELVAFGDGAAVRVAADAEAVRWEYAGAEHVAAPLEVVRVPEGNAALLPWCTRSLGALVAQRRAAGEPPEAGECVTLAVSLLRGIGEVDGADAAGSWWVTVEGRPVVVPGGDGSARDAAAQVLASLGDASTERTLQRMLAEISEAVRDRPPSAAQRGQWEDALCEFAAPRAVRTEVFAPADASVARALRPVPTLRRRDRRAGRSATIIESVCGRARELVGHVLERTAALGERRYAAARGRRATSGGGGGVAAASASVASAEPARRSTSGRRMLVAGAAAAAVLLVGVLWPEGEDPAEAGVEASYGVGGVVSEADPAGAAASSEANPAGAGAGGAALDTSADVVDRVADSPATDPVAAAGTVMRALQECLASGDAQCDAIVAEGMTVDLSVVTGAAASPAELVDEYGDVAVVRVGAGAEERMLVLIRRNDIWLVRDVLDVADQPDGSD